MDVQLGANTTLCSVKINENERDSRFSAQPRDGVHEIKTGGERFEVGLNEVIFGAIVLIFIACGYAHFCGGSRKKKTKSYSPSEIVVITMNHPESDLHEIIRGRDADVAKKKLVG